MCLLRVLIIARGRALREEKYYGLYAEHLRETHEWRTKNLPSADSFKKYAFMIAIMALYYEDVTITFKVLCSQLKMSTRVVRMYVREFEEDGYLICEKSSRDQRNLLIRPSSKLISKFQRYTEVCGFQQVNN